MAKVKIAEKDYKIEDVQHICMKSLESGRISKWEEEFCISMMKCVNKFGVKLKISEKQYEILKRLESKAAYGNKNKHTLPLGE